MGRIDQFVRDQIHAFLSRRKAYTVRCGIDPENMLACGLNDARDGVVIAATDIDGDGNDLVTFLIPASDALALGNELIRLANSIGGK